MSNRAAEKTDGFAGSRPLSRANERIGNNARGSEYPDTTRKPIRPKAS
ncbi:hypothetical protein [Streptomyces lateritius]|nr:hypothetical protein [Streptomyces lateritius]MBX9425451.1 hypothetical protein [Streptomyces lateritius]